MSLLLSFLLAISPVVDSCTGCQEWLDSSNPLVYAANKDDCYFNSWRYFETNPLDKRLVVAARNDMSATFESLFNGACYKFEKGRIVEGRLANNLYVIDMAGNSLSSISRLLRMLRDNDSVSYFERIYEGESYSVVPNDVYLPGPSTSPAYWYEKIGLFNAWEISTGSSAKTVGFIDSGINGNHQDFLANLNTNLSHSFSDQSIQNALCDPVGHGSIVGGIIAGYGNNSTALCGTSWYADLVSIQANGPATNNPFGPSQGYHETTVTFANALDYAQSIGLKLVNFSGGFSSSELHSQFDSPFLGSTLTNLVIHTVYDAVSSFDGLLVVAAGNYGNDIDQAGNEVYPASFDLDNLLVVGASNADDYISSYANSCYGQSSVDLFAPGEYIYGPDNVSTTGLQSNSSLRHGTSFAAPMVTGVAHLMRSVNSSLSPLEIKDLILDNVSKNETTSPFYHKCFSNGRLDAYKALKAALPKVSVLQTSYGGGSDYVISGSIDRRWVHVLPVSQSGTYTIYSSSGLAIEGDLYDDQNTLIAHGDAGSGSGSGSVANFALSAHLSANTDYYLRVHRTAGSFAGPFTIYASFIAD